MARKIKKIGFSLVEMSIVMAIAGSYMLVDSDQREFQRIQDHAKAMGREISNYNSAVAKYITNYSGSPNLIGVTQESSKKHSGANWLRPTSCGGQSDIGFLSCTEFPDNKTTNLGSRPTTTISINDEGVITARTVWSPVTQTVPEDNSTALGLAALTASGSYISSFSSNGSGHQEPSIYCPDIDAYPSTYVETCKSDQNRIVSMASTNGNTDTWLRTDHGNTMNHVIEFREGGGDKLSQSDINGVDNKSIRQIVNVSRIYNIGDDGDESIIFGRWRGNAVYSDSFISANDLLSNSVIIDGDLGVMRDIYAKGNLLVGGDASLAGNVDVGGKLSVDGDIIGGRDIIADRNLKAGNSVYADFDVNANRDIKAGRDVNASRNVAAINDVTAGDTLRGQDLVVKDTMEALVWYDSTYGRKSFGSGGYVVNPSHQTRLNDAVFEGRAQIESELQLNRVNTRGSSCSTIGLVSRDSKGQLLSCQGGRWERAVDAVPEGLYGYFRSSRCPERWVKANGSNGTVDLRGEFIRGWDDGRGVDAGRGLGSFQNQELQKHRHELMIEGNQNQGNHQSLVKSDNSDEGFARSSESEFSDYAGGEETRPRNRALLACMKSN